MSLTRIVVFYIAGLFLILVLKCPLMSALDIDDETQNSGRTWPENNSNRNNILFKQYRKSHPFDVKKDSMYSTYPSKLILSPTSNYKLIGRTGNFVLNRPSNQSKESTSKIVRMSVLDRHRRNIEERSQCKHRKTMKVDSKGSHEVKRCSERRKQYSGNSRKLKKKSDFKNNEQEKVALPSSKLRKKMKNINNKKTYSPKAYRKNGLQNQKTHPYERKNPFFSKGKKNFKGKQWRKKPVKQNFGSPKKTSPHRTGAITYRGANALPDDENLRVLKKNSKPSRFVSKKNSKYSGHRPEKHKMHMKQNEEQLDNPSDESVHDHSEISVKDNVSAAPIVKQTSKILKPSRTKSSVRLQSNFLYKLKHKRKVGLHRSSHKKPNKVNETAVNIRKLRFLHGLGRGIRNANKDILKDVKDFLVKNFPANKYKRTPEIDLNDLESKKGILNQVKEFLENNFHPDRTRRNISKIDSSSQVNSDSTKSTSEVDANFVESVTSDRHEDEIGTGNETKNARRDSNFASNEQDADSDEDETPSSSEEDKLEDDSIDPYLTDENNDESFQDEERDTMISESNVAYTRSVITVSEKSVDDPPSPPDKNKTKNSKRDAGGSLEIPRNSSRNAGDMNSSHQSEVRATQKLKKSNENIQGPFLSSSTHFVAISREVLDENQASSFIYSKSTLANALDPASATDAAKTLKIQSKVFRDSKNAQSEDYDYDTSPQVSLTSTEIPQGGDQSNRALDSTSNAYEKQVTINSMNRNQRKKNKNDEYDEDLQVYDEYSPVTLKPDDHDKPTDLDEKEENYDSNDTIKPNNSKTPKAMEKNEKDKYLSKNSEKRNRKLTVAPDLDEDPEGNDYVDKHVSNDSKSPRSIETDSRDQKLLTNSQDLDKTDDDESKISIKIDDADRNSSENSVKDSKKLKDSNGKDENKDFGSEDTIESKAIEIDSKEEKSSVNIETDNRKSKDLQNLNESDEDQDSEDAVEASKFEAPDSEEADSEEKNSPVNSEYHNGNLKDLSNLNQNEEDSDFVQRFVSNDFESPMEMGENSKAEEKSIQLEAEDEKSEDSPDLVKKDTNTDSEDTLEPRKSKIPKAIEIDSEDENSPINLKTDTKLTDSEDLDENEEDSDSKDTVLSNNSQLQKKLGTDDEEEESQLNLKTTKRKSKDFSSNLDKNNEDYPSEDTVDSKQATLTEIDNEEENSPVNSKISARKSKHSPDLNENDDYYDSEYTNESSNSKVPKGIKKLEVSNSRKNSPLSAKTNRRKSTDSSDLNNDFEEYDYEDSDSTNSNKQNPIERTNENNDLHSTSKTDHKKSTDLLKLENEEQDDFKDTFESANSKIPKAIEKNSRNIADSSDLKESDTDYDEENALDLINSNDPKATVKASKHKSEKETSEGSRQQKGYKKHRNENSLLATNDESEYDEHQDLISTTSTILQPHKLRKKPKPKNLISKRLPNNNLKHKVFDSTNMEKEKKATDRDFNDHRPKTEFYSDTSLSAADNDLPEYENGANYVDSRGEISNNLENKGGEEKINAVRSPDESTEKVSKIKLEYLEPSLNWPVKDDEFNDSNVTHSVQLQKIEIKPKTTTVTYSESRNAEVIKNSRDEASRPKKEYKIMNNTDEEYDYEGVEQSNASKNPKHNSVFKFTTTNNETTSSGYSNNFNKKNIQKDELDADALMDISDPALNSKENGKENESVSLNRAKAHQDNAHELALKSKTSSPVNNKTVQKKNITPDSISNYSGVDYDSDRSNDKINPIDKSKMKEDKETSEYEFLDRPDASSSAGQKGAQENEMAAKPVSEDLENNVNAEKRADEENNVSDTTSKSKYSSEHYGGKTKRGEDKLTSLQFLKKFLNSLIHEKIEERRNKNSDSIHHKRVRRTRDTLSVEPIAFSEVTSKSVSSEFIQTSRAKSWLYGLAGSVMVVLMTAGLYKLALERSRKTIAFEETLASDDLKEVFVEDDDMTSDAMFSKDGSDSEMCNRWANDGRHLHNFITQVLQNSEISENGTIKDKYSAVGHTSKINLAMSGNLE